jgi:glycosyltransferase involved in cell wall biosynthesis
MLSQATLTVAIPTYNRLYDLKACLKSVEASCALVEDIVEICVGDNCSTDGTLEFLESYVSPAPNVTFRWKRNPENIGGTRNIRSMLDFCRGQYIYWVTDDDLILPNALATVIDVIRKSAPSYIRTAMIVSLVASKHAFYSGNKVSGTVEVGSSGFWQLLKLSHVLTGSVHINNPKILATINANENIYVCADMLLYNMNKLASIAEVCNIHIWENEVFWEKEINYINDSGNERKKKERKLNLDFQLCIYNSPEYKALDKTGLVKFLSGNYGFLCSEIHQDIQESLKLMMTAIVGMMKFKAKFVARNIYMQLKKVKG